MLLLVNYRPEYRHDWGGRSYYTQLRLDPLGSDGAREMLTALLGDLPELAPVKQVIAARTEGNPFFIEEIVQALFEEGVLAGNGRVKLARPFSHTSIPTTVQGMLGARIDRLPREEKELLQTLAVVGREFPLRLAQQVASCSEPQLEAALAHLQSAEFVHEQPTAGDVVFKHALTQEVAYNSLLMEHRKLLHERIAAAIESLFADRLDDYLKDLAHHYRRSNNTVKAVEYLRRAGEKAALRALYEEAIEQLNSALELLEKLEPGKARDEHELAIRTVLMGPLVAARALATPEMLLNSERCRNSVKRRVIRDSSPWCWFTYSFSIVRRVWTKLGRLPAERWNCQGKVAMSFRFSVGILFRGCLPPKKGNILQLANISNEQSESVSRRRI
jgi:predicted ATPase